MFTLFFMSHFCCPDSPKLRLHKYPLLPVLFQVLYCSVSFPGHPPVLLAGDGDIFRAGWAAPWCSFCPLAWIFCCRSYFTRIDLYRALIAENNCAWEREKKATTARESIECIERIMWGQLTGSPKKLHVSHAVSTAAGPDVAFGGCPAVPSTTQPSGQPQLLGKLTAVLQTDTGRCLLKIFREFLPYLFKLLHPWIPAARPLLTPREPRRELPCACPEFNSSASPAALEALWGFGWRQRGCFQAGAGCPFPEESCAVPCHVSAGSVPRACVRCHSGSGWNTSLQVRTFSSRVNGSIQE